MTYWKYFAVALLLAIPTFGISLLIFFLFKFYWDHQIYKLLIQKHFLPIYSAIESGRRLPVYDQWQLFRVNKAAALTFDAYLKDRKDWINSCTVTHKNGVVLMQNSLSITDTQLFQTQIFYSPKFLITQIEVGPLVESPPHWESIEEFAASLCHYRENNHYSEIMEIIGEESEKHCNITSMKRTLH